MKYIVLSLSLILFACNTTSETVQEETKEKLEVDTTTSTPSEMPGKTVIRETGAACKNHVSGSVLKKGAFQKTQFELQPDKITGIETIDMENGDKVIIKNWGCDYVALTFRFETSRFQEEVSNAGFWYKRAVTLLNEINKNIDAPVDVVKGTERLVTEIEAGVPNGYQDLKFNQEFDFGQDTTRNFVTIDEVEKITDKKFALKITFARGPL